jgi:putative ABC transport system permease protein
VLVAGEIALALVLLIGTALLIRGIFVTGHQNLGFHADHLLTANVTLDEAHYKQPLQQVQFVKEAISRLEQIPGAQSVAATSDLPATPPGKFTFHIADQPELPNNDQRTVLDTVVTNQFFSAAAIPLFRGRLFTEMDNGAVKRVVVVNQQFVERYFQGQNPLGKQIRLDVPRTASQWSEIVGVVGNVKTYSLATREEPEVYEAFLQRPVSSFSFMLRTSADPGGSTPALRQAIAQVDAELPLSAVMTMSSVLDRQKGGDSLFSQILSLFALLALVLAGIGIYGLIAYSVGQRAREIGIRMAMGAGKPHVLRMVVGEGMKISAVGAAIGIVIALPLPKLFESMFEDFPAREPGLFVVVPFLLLMIGAFATYLPARRATHVDPMQALRQD